MFFCVRQINHMNKLSRAQPVLHVSGIYLHGLARPPQIDFSLFTFQFPLDILEDMLLGGWTTVLRDNLKPIGHHFPPTLSNESA